MKQVDKNSFGYLITQVNNQLIKLLNRNFAKNHIDITREQYVVLKTRWENEQVNQQQIATILNKDKYSITKLIDGLEKRNLVKRVGNANDRRQKLIELTPMAMKIKPDVEKITNLTIEKALDGISNDELYLIHKLLNKIICNITNGEE